MAPAPTPTMTRMYRWVKSDRNMTILVGKGSSAPMPWNILANVGMTKIIMNTMTSTATLMMVTGYTMAPFTLLLSLAAFSMYPDKRCSTTSSTPPDSPTWSMLVKRSLKTFGYFRNDSARVEPEVQMEEHTSELQS